MIKRLAIIPARGGSKRIKNKNIKKLKNKELISYSINAAICSNIFSKIHVSSDNNKILKYAEKLNIKTDFVRKKNLSNDKTPLWPVLSFVVKKYLKMNFKFDEIWLIYATNPLITTNIILNCKKKFEAQKKKKNPLMTVTKYNYPLEWAHKIKKNGLLEPIYSKKLNIRSQDLKSYYCDAGMIIVYPAEIFYSKIKSKLKFLPYILSIFESVDIDNLDDFFLAEKLIKK